MKFKTFAKIFSICFSSLVGVFALTLGIMFIAGSFKDKVIMPENLAFEFSSYNVDADFTAKLTTKTSDVTKKNITLTLQSVNKIEVLDDNYITDGVIAIPTNTKIGEEFTVKLIKQINDEEVNGLDWIQGGHSVIVATSENELINSAKTEVNVDVPVYSVSLETKATPNDVDFSDTYVLESNFYTYLNFLPKRSAYRFSNDGTNGKTAEYKQAFFSTDSLNDQTIQQVSFSNIFKTIKVAENVEIDGYCFSSAITEDIKLKEHASKPDAVRYAALLRDLEEMVNDNSLTFKKAAKGSGKVNIVDIVVDSMDVNGNIGNVFVDKEYTVFANKQLSDQDINSADLSIVLKSSVDSTVSLQNKLSNIGLRFLLKQGNTYVDTINNTNSALNLVEMIEGGFDRIVAKDGKTYYMPVTNSLYWKFAVKNSAEVQNLMVEINYLETDVEIQSVKKSFETNPIISAPVAWDASIENSSIDIKIYGSNDASKITYEEYNVESKTSVPSANLYQTKKYFAYSETRANLSEYIHCADKVTYTITGNSYDLYEITDGIVKAKSATAHNISFKVMFFTVETDYKGNVKTTEENNVVKYVINQYSQNVSGILSSIQFNVTKTLNGINALLQCAQDSLPITDNNNPNRLIYVQNLPNPFDIYLSNQYNSINTENEIFKQAILNHNIFVVAKIGEVDTELIEYISEPISSGEDFIFSMKINNLELGNSKSVVKLYVRYIKSSTVTEDTLITTYKTNTENEVFNDIEIYDGAAVKFTFNLNDQGLTSGNINSENNPVIVSSTITGHTETSPNIYLVDEIASSYKQSEKDISKYLFKVNNVGGKEEIDFTNINVLFEDLYGKIPLNVSYSLRSTNTKVLVVVGNTVTFAGSGKANLELIDANGDVKDIIYFESIDAGKITQVKKINETISSQNQAQTVADTVFNYDAAQENYNFPQLTVSVYGYSGQRVFLNSDIAGKINLLTYYYTTKDGKVYDLTGMIKFRFKGEESYLEANHIFAYDYDFAEQKNIALIAEVPELGILQEIILNILPTVILDIQAHFHAGAESKVKDIITYSGVFAETTFKIDVKVTFLIKSTDGVNTTLALDASKYILSYADKKLEFSRPDLETMEIADTVDFVMNFNGDYDFVIIPFIKENAQGALRNIYAYVNPNIKIVSYNKDIVYLGGADGKQIDVSSFIQLARLHGTEALKNDISYSVLESSIGSFNINGSILSSNSELNAVAKVKILVNYMGYNVKNGALKQIINEEEKYYIELLIAPDIKIDTEINNYVLYGGKNYIKIVDGTSFANKAEFEKYILSSFVGLNETNASVKNINELLQRFELSSILNKDINTGKLTFGGFSERIVFNDISNEKYSAVINLSINDYTLAFDFIMLPGELPFVKYSQETSSDLKDLLDIEYLKTNTHIAYELFGADGKAQTNMAFAENDFENSNYGIKQLNASGCIYTVENLNSDDTFAYATISQAGVLTPVAVGSDTYIIIKQRLSANAGALVIPYLVVIKKELSLNIYYPYLNGISNNGEISGNDIITNSYDMEYVSFNDTKQATVDFAQKQTSLIPNKSLFNKRYDVTRLNSGELEAVSEDSLGMLYSVEEIYYYTNLAGWSKDITGTYASFDKLNKSKLVIKANSASAVRVKIKIYTPTGVKGFYYISAGEIPNFTFTELKNGVASTVISDFTLTAQKQDTTKLNSYKLSLLQGSATNDFTNLLNFYSSEDILNIDLQNHTLNANSTVKDKDTRFIIYTKYGMLANVNVHVYSNYKLNIYDATISSAQDFDFKDSVIISNNNAAVSVWNITEFNFTLGKPVFISVDGNVLHIGATDTEITISIIVTTDIEENGEFYTFTFNLTILSSIQVAKYNNSIISDLNPFPITAKITGGAQVRLPLNNLFTLLNSISSFEDLKNGNFTYEVINGKDAVSNSFGDIDVQEGIVLQTNIVAKQTITTVKVIYKNTTDSFEFVSYFNFTVVPNFTVEINYPQSQEGQDVLEKELFFMGTSASAATFSFNQIPLIGTVARVVIAITDETLGKDYNFKIKVGSASDGIKISTNKADVTNGTLFDIGDEIKFESTDSNLTFDVQFVVFSETLQAEVATYNMLVCKNIESVYTVTSYNFISTGNNKQDNRETVFIDENSQNILNTVRLSYNISAAQAATGFFNIYMGTPENNVIILNKQPYNKLTDLNNLRTILVDLPAEVKNLPNSSLFALEVDIAGASVEDSKLQVSGLNVTARINLAYAGKLVDFNKTYKLILNSNSIQNSLKGEIVDKVESVASITLNNYNISDYYINYKFNVAFNNATNIKLETSQSINLISNNKNQNSWGAFHIGNLGMFNLKENRSYIESDFTDTSVKLLINSIDYYNSSNKVPENKLSNRGYLTYEANTNSNNVIYDYLIIAHGAPNSDIYADINIKIYYGEGDNAPYQTFIIPVIITNDYINVSLINHDGTPNGANNPFVVVSPNAQGSTYTFATISNTLQNNYLFLQHKNNPSVNAAVSFVLIFNQGENFAERVINSQSLTLLFQYAMFGNKRIDITLKDNYGYELNYFIIIQAETNPEYKGGALSLYENDTLELYADTIQNSGQNIVNIQISGVSTLFDIDVNYEFYKKEFSDSADNGYIKVDVFDNKKIMFLGDKLFASGNLVGRLDIKLTKTLNGVTDTALITVNATIRQKYTIKQVDNDLYVRDGVEFNLLDVIDVVDNKNNINVGERKLVETNTLKYEYISKENPLTNMPDNSTIGVKLKNKITQESIYYPLTTERTANGGEAYLFINEIFEAFNLANYELHLTYELYKDGETTEHNFWHNNEIQVQGIQITQFGEFKFTNVCLTKDSNENFTFNISLVYDQMLYIGTRNIDGKEITVHFDNKTSMKIPCKDDEMVTMSLYKNGIIDGTSGTLTKLQYFTDTKTTIINGLTEYDLALLKGVSFKDPDTMMPTNTMMLTLNTQDALITESISKIKYQLCEKTINILYAYDEDIDQYNGNTEKTLNFKVTLKYTGVDTYLAYGAGDLKQVYINPINVKDNKIIYPEGQEGLQIDFLNWAGQVTDSSAFKLITGISTVAKVAGQLEDLDFVSNKDNIDIKLNAVTGSGATNNMVRLDEYFNLIISNDFHTINNHISLDIYIKYGSQAENKHEYISTVTISLRAPNIEHINAKNANKVYAEINANNEINITLKDILNAYEFVDIYGNKWTGENSVNLGMYINLKYINQYGNALNEIYEVNSDTIDLSFKIKTTTDEFTIQFLKREHQTVSSEYKINIQTSKYSSFTNTFAASKDVMSILLQYANKEMAARMFAASITYTDIYKKYGLLNTLLNENLATVVYSKNENGITVYVDSSGTELTTFEQFTVGKVVIVAPYEINANQNQTYSIALIKLDKTLQILKDFTVNVKILSSYNIPNTDMILLEDCITVPLIPSNIDRAFVAQITNNELNIAQIIGIDNTIIECSIDNSKPFNVIDGIISIDKSNSIVIVKYKEPEKEVILTASIYVTIDNEASMVELEQLNDNFATSFCIAMFNEVPDASTKLITVDGKEKVYYYKTIRTASEDGSREILTKIVMLIIEKEQA